MSPVQPSTFSSPGARRRTTQVAVLMLALSLAGVALGEPIRRYETLTLKDGRQLSGVQIVTYTTTDVLVRHSGGATSLRTDLLPDQLIIDLHLPIPLTPQAIAADPAFMALAGKVAVSDRPAVAEVAAPGPAQPASAPVAEGDSNVSAAQLLAAAHPEAPGSAPAGEGNLPEFTAKPATAAHATPGNWVTLPGRVAVALPSGETHLLADVEVRAYPAELLAKYLVEARAKGVALAQQFRDQAAIEAQAGRLAESAALVARADKTAGNYLDFLPPAPYSARSDAFGSFTLKIDLREPRLVAVGRINVTRGEWTYTWAGIAPGAEPLLTEGNATAVSTPEGTSLRVAVQ